MKHNLEIVPNQNIKKYGACRRHSVDLMHWSNLMIIK